MSTKKAAHKQTTDNAPEAKASTRATSPVQAPAPRSRAHMLELVFPKDTNYHGTAFGGFVLSLMDKAASVAAVRHAKGEVVTARMDGIDFRTPIRVGDAVALDDRDISVGSTSMIIVVDVYREHMASGKQALAHWSWRSTAWPTAAWCSPEPAP